MAKALHSVNSVSLRCWAFPYLRSELRKLKLHNICGLAHLTRTWWRSSPEGNDVKEIFVGLEVHGQEVPQTKRVTHVAEMDSWLSLAVVGAADLPKA